MRKCSVNQVQTVTAVRCINLIHRYMAKSKYVCAGPGVQSASVVFQRGVTCVCVSCASPSGWSDGSCLPERAWRGRRLSISAASTRTKHNSKLPVRNWRASFWQPSRLVINSTASNPLQFVYFHVFVLNWLQKGKKIAASLKGILMLLWSERLMFSLPLAVKSASCAVFPHTSLDFISWILCVWWLLMAIL